MIYEKTLNKPMTDKKIDEKEGGHLEKIYILCPDKREDFFKGKETSYREIFGDILRKMVLLVTQ